MVLDLSAFLCLVLTNCMLGFAVYFHLMNAGSIISYRTGLRPGNQPNPSVHHSLMKVWKHINGKMNGEMMGK